MRYDEMILIVLSSVDKTKLNSTQAIGARKNKIPLRGNIMIPILYSYKSNQWHLYWDPIWISILMLMTMVHIVVTLPIQYVDVSR